MKYLTLMCILLSGLNQSCGEKEAKAKEQPNMVCEVVYGSNSFERCENQEVVCYMNTEGLSCKWKE